MLKQKAFLFYVAFFLGYFLIMVPDTRAQDPIFFKFSEEEGLPSNDVYDVLVDAGGIMWFATDNGVCRYDGNVFVDYNVSNGLPTNSILKLYEDIFGRIWFLAYNGMLSYFEKGEIFAYSHNDSIIKYFHDNYFNKIYVDSSGGILLSPRHGGKGYIKENGTLHTDTKLKPSRLDSCYLAFEDRGDDYFLTIQSLAPSQCSNAGNLYYIDNSYYIHGEFGSRQFQRNYVKIADGEFVVSYRDCVYYIKDKRIIHSRYFKEEILSLYVDDQARLWVSVKYDHGIYMFENSEMKGPGTHYLNGLTITSITQDHEGDYWLGTEGNGVYFLPSFEFKLFKLPDDERNLNVMALTTSGNRLWFTTRSKQLYAGQLSEGKIGNIRQVDIGEPFDWIKHICIDSKGMLWLSSTKYLRYDPAGIPRPPDTVMSSIFLTRGLGDTMIVASRKLGVYHNDKLLYVTDPDSSRRVYAGYHDNEHGLWLGTLYGLYIFTNERAYYKGNISPFLQERISCIDMLNDMLVIGTSAHGLLLVKDDSVHYHITPENGLIGNSVKSLFVQNDSIVWIGTKDGLNKITFGPDMLEYDLDSYSQSDGLPSGVVNGILMHDEYIWLATGMGLVSFDPEKLKPHLTPPAIHINSILINGRDTCLHDAFELAYNQNNIRINFSGISYRSEEGLRYRYMLSNYDDAIIETKNQWANFPNLPPGEYTFFLNVGNVHGVWNEEPMQFDFLIKKHFTQTVWFILMLILITAFSVVSITMFFQHQKKIKQKARIELIKLEQKLFQLQMNPHFVFNALLAIQGYMYMNKPREAGRYLTSFAKLIRHTLYGSSEEYTTLDKEIEALQYYMELQRLRFDEHFEFTIELDDDLIPESLLIPPLLLQPFLENAIEHGLQHREKDGLLKLKMIMAEECLKVEIEDNGIGREESEKMQRGKGKLHKSMGLEIVRKRVDSLNRIMMNKIDMDIVDLYNDKGKSRGTLVKLCIPYKSS